VRKKTRRRKNNLGSIWLRNLIPGNLRKLIRNQRKVKGLRDRELKRAKRRTLMTKKRTKIKMSEVSKAMPNI
tara:strand:+ start:656 stop:871 length:216 start_codon:yes stop_codon:yes gene_type:complete